MKQLVVGYQCTMHLNGELLYWLFAETNKDFYADVIYNDDIIIMLSNNNHEYMFRDKFQCL